MKKIIILVAFLKISFGFSQQVRSINDFVGDFMTAMSKQEKLDNYVNNVNDRIVNYFRVDKYQIKSIADNEAIIEIDHGKGIYCTRIYLTIINTNGIYKIKSYANKNPRLVNPWERKEKMCN